MRGKNFVFVAEESDKTAIKALEYLNGSGNLALKRKGVFCGKISAKVINGGAKLTDFLKDGFLPVPVFESSEGFIITRRYNLPFQAVPKWGRGSSRILAVPKEISEEELFNALVEVVVR